MTTTYPDKPTLTDVASALDAYSSKWQTRDEALLARIAELEAAVPPPVERTIFGCSRPDWIAGRPLVPAVRTYLNATQRPSSYQADSGLVRALQYATDAIVLSFKADAGEWLDSLLDSLAGVSPTLYVCDWHEPYDNWIRNPAGYHARRDVSTPIIDNHPHAIACTILDGYRVESWDTFARDDVKVNGVDRYNLKSTQDQIPDEYHDPADLFGPYLAWAAARGTRTLVGETNTKITKTGTEAGRKAWYADAHAVLEDGGVEVACLWPGVPAMIPPADSFNSWLLG